MITFVQVISIAMKKNRSVIITKQGAPVALLLVVALVAACGLLSCSHGGDARGGDAHPSDSLAEASIFVEVIEKRQGLKIACLEDIAFRQGWITAEKMRELAQPMAKNPYGQYLLKQLEQIDR